MASPWYEIERDLMAPYTTDGFMGSIEVDGDQRELVLRPQRHGALNRVVVHGSYLLRLRVGIIEVPIRFVSVIDWGRVYYPQLYPGSREIAYVAGQELRILVRDFDEQQIPQRVRLTIRDDQEDQREEARR